jgi:hypothetical protein
MFRITSLALLFLSSSSAAAAASLNVELFSQDFVLWTSSFNKQYESDEDAKRAFETWQLNDGTFCLFACLLLRALVLVVFCRFGKTAWSVASFTKKTLDELR